MAHHKFKRRTGSHGNEKTSFEKLTEGNKTVCGIKETMITSSKKSARIGNKEIKTNLMLNAPFIIRTTHKKGKNTMPCGKKKTAYKIEEKGIKYFRNISSRWINRN